MVITQAPDLGIFDLCWGIIVVEVGGHCEELCVLEYRICELLEHNNDDMRSRLLHSECVIEFTSPTSQLWGV